MIGLFILAAGVFILFGVFVVYLIQHWEGEFVNYLLAFFILFFLFVGGVSMYLGVDEARKEVKCTVAPQIDTIIITKNSVSDTTYIYKFEEYK